MKRNEGGTSVGENQKILIILQALSNFVHTFEFLNTDKETIDDVNIFLEV